MKEYKDRTYRDAFRSDRWRGFVVQYKEADIWVGVDKVSFVPVMQDFALESIRRLRDEMDEYLSIDPDYARSLIPYEPMADAPQLMKQMAKASHKAGIGPMASVAGAFAVHIAKELKTHFAINEIMIENGGDIYADIQGDIDVFVFAGESVLSEKIGLHVKASESPLGICTSSGTVGPSLSFGKADAVMIVCRDILLADSYATAFANRIQTVADIEPVLEEIKKEKSILSALIVKDDKVGIAGKFEMRVRSTQDE
jgi:Uncharacterized conserved protein